MKTSRSRFKKFGKKQNKTQLAKYNSGSEWYVLFVEIYQCSFERPRVRCNWFRKVRPTRTAARRFPNPACVWRATKTSEQGTGPHSLPLLRLPLEKWSTHRKTHDLRCDRFSGRRKQVLQKSKFAYMATGDISHAGCHWWICCPGSDEGMSLPCYVCIILFVFSPNSVWCRILGLQFQVFAHQAVTVLRCAWVPNGKQSRRRPDGRDVCTEEDALWLTDRHLWSRFPGKAGQLQVLSGIVSSLSDN